MIGPRLHELRTARSLSLRALGDETGLSATLLSQIERGRVEPSLRSLRMLATFFGQSVSALFAPDGVTTVHVSRPGDRSRISSPRGHIQYERLAPSNGRMEVLRGLLAAGDSSSDELWSHDALECAFVISGVLTVFIGKTRHQVSAGVAITLDSNQPHRYCNESSSPVEFILSVTPPTP